MACHNYSLILQGYYQFASAGSNASFHSWLKQNTPAESPSQCSAHSKGSVAVIDQPVIPDDIQVTESEKRLLKDGVVDDAYIRYLASESFPDAQGFEHFVRDDLGFTMSEPSEGLFGFGRKKTPEELAAEKAKKDAKKEMDEKIAAEKNKMKQLQQMEKIQKEGAKKLEEIQQKTHEAKVNTEKTKQISDQVLKEKEEKHQKEMDELQKQKQQSASEAILGKLFSPKQTKPQETSPILAWQIEDANLIEQSIEQSHLSTTADIKRTKELLDSLLSNKEVANILDTVSDKIDTVDREGVLKLLSIVVEHPKVANGLLSSNRTSITQMKWVGGDSIEFYGLDHYTPVTYYDVYLAYNAICKGDIHKDIVNSNVSKEKVTITTFEWDSELVDALVEKLTSVNPATNPALINRLRQFVICICNNVTLKDIVKKTQSEITRNGAPRSALGYALLFGLWRDHPTKAVTGKVKASTFIDSTTAGYQEFLSSPEQVKTAKVTDLVKAYIVYQKLKDYYKKNYMMKMKHQFSPASARSGIDSHDFALGESSQLNNIARAEEYENEIVQIFVNDMLTQLRSMNSNRAREVATSLQLFANSAGMDTFTSLVGHSDYDAYKQLQLLLNNYRKCLLSYSMIESSSHS